MSPDLIRSFIPFLGAAVVAWLTWVTVSHWSTKKELAELKLYMSENYAKNDALKAIDAKLEHISGMVHTLVGRLSIPAAKE